MFNTHINDLNTHTYIWLQSWPQSVEIKLVITHNKLNLLWYTRWKASFSFNNIINIIIACIMFLEYIFFLLEHNHFIRVTKTNILLERFSFFVLYFGPPTTYFPSGFHRFPRNSISICIVYLYAFTHPLLLA